MNKRITLICCLLFGAYILQAQTVITGTVTDEGNEPLTGVTVLLAGTSRGEITDVDGRFSIAAQSGDVLKFSYLGMQPLDVEVTGQQAIKVVLEADAAQLDEVVVIGYGALKRSDVTGSIASLKSEDFNQGVVASPGQLLQGKVAGVNITSASGEPGAAQDIIIRGIGSLRSGTTPLFVVDGFALDNSTNGVPTNPLNFINPQDIESIDVLKDASAAAIYGARAANGVIVITTRKGRAGAIPDQCFRLHGRNDPGP